ncbi:MAG: hypothetical protein U0903_00815 [Planctomycetales bacterium]
MLALCAAGCRYEYRSDSRVRENQNQTFRNRDLGTSRLGAQLRTAFQGDRDAARAYYGTYQVLADCVADSRFGWKKPADIERDVIATRELLDLRHQQFPEVTRIVTERLNPLKENRELTTESRDQWRQALEELAQGCREAGR